MHAFKWAFDFKGFWQFRFRRFKLTDDEPHIPIKKLKMNILEQYKNEIEALCKKHSVKSLYAFGSVNTPRFRTESDVDFIVDLGEKSDLEYAEAYFQLAEELEQILNRSVDLLTVRSLKNPFFIQKVEESKSLLYAV